MSKPSKPSNLPLFKPSKVRVPALRYLRKPSNDVIEAQLLNAWQHGNMPTRREVKRAMQKAYRRRERQIQRQILRDMRA